MKRCPQGRYSKELREESVKVVTEEKLSIPETARRLNLPMSTLENWIRKYRAGKPGEIGINYRTLTETEMELARLNRENAELRMERTYYKKQPRILRKSGCRVRDDEETAAYISVTAALLCIEGICQWYYSEGDGPLSKWAHEEAGLDIEIKAAQRRTREVYGAGKLQHDLAWDGIKAGVCRIKRINKRKLGLRCKQKRKFKAITD